MDSSLPFSSITRAFFLLLTSLLFTTSIFSQDTIIDPRDSEIYPIVKLGDTWWFQSNLRYETRLSWCEGQKDHYRCESNYYSYQTLDSVCPPGWRIPTWQDWEAAVDLYQTAMGIEDSTLETENIEHESLRSSERVIGLNLFNDSTGLQLQSTGWIQGHKAQSDRKLAKYPAATFWILEPEAPDSTLHLHIYEHTYVKHGHDFHIRDKAKKVRRFTVRCVR
ncbi:hypothetical protein KFE98_16920 [bacterium SCSIO 12741]|nr:hypothetical protein KFE98_16920 [bacterium SCSIO 12741]